MRWLTFAIFAFVFLVLERGFRGLWCWPGTDIAPQLLLILAVYVALWAPPLRLAWACMVLGLLMDATAPLKVAGPTPDVVVLGPAALGLLAGGYVCLQLRSMVFRDSTVTVAVMTFVLGCAAHLVIVGLLVLRRMDLVFLPGLAGSPSVAWSAADQLWRRFLESLYSAVWAVPWGYVLLKSHPLWGFSAGRPAAMIHPR